MKELENLPPQEVDYTRFMGSRAIILGEYHSSLRTIQAIKDMTPDLVARGFNLFCMEGVPAGTIYQSDQPVEEFVTAHLGAERREETADMISGLVAAGITVTGADLQPEEFEEFESMYKPRFALTDEEAERVTSRVKQFQLYLPFLMRGVDPEKEIDSLRAAGITLAPDELSELLKPDFLEQSFARIQAAHREIMEEFDRTIVNRRDEQFAVNFLRELDVTDNKGVLYIGNHHCRREPTSTTQRVLQSGISTNVVLFTGVAESLRDLPVAVQTLQRDSMFDVGSSYWLVNLPEQVS